jgi:hypothetical protein
MFLSQNSLSVEAFATVGNGDHVPFLVSFIFPFSLVVFSLIPHTCWQWWLMLVL